MDGLKNAGVVDGIAKGSPQRESGEDEVAILDYFVLVWRHRWLVLLCSVIPTVIAGAIILLAGSSYKVTYTYSNPDFDEEDYKIFLSCFYSAPNIKKLREAFVQEGIREGTGFIESINSGSHKVKVHFDVWPEYEELAEAMVASPDATQVVPQKARLLLLSVTGNQDDDLIGAARAVRRNVEDLIPLLGAERMLKGATREFRTKALQIERGRYLLERSLESSRNVLARLKGIEPVDSRGDMKGVALQFDIGGGSEYLPVEYHVQATEVKIAQMEENLVQTQKTYEYYRELMALHAKIFAEIEDKKNTGYGVRDLCSFLSACLNDADKTEVKAYVSSLIKTVENETSLSMPVTENPATEEVSKQLKQKTSVVFMTCLFLSVFAAFLVEGVQRRRAAAA